MLSAATARFSETSHAGETCPSPMADTRSDELVAAQAASLASRAIKEVGVADEVCNVASSSKSPVRQLKRSFYK